MPIMSFKARFVDPIHDGSKVHTFRAGVRLVRPGQTLYMQTGPRYKARRFSEKYVLRVRDCTISDQTVMIWHETGSGFIVPPLDQFAHADGFRDWADLREFFLEMHGRQGPSGAFFLVKGQLIQWASATWETPLDKMRKKGRCIFAKRCQNHGPCYWDRCRFYKEKA
jgi:hypothetical protein